jgi:hypothetical protein
VPAKEALYLRHIITAANMIEHNKTRHERSIKVTLSVFEDAKGQPRFMLDYFQPDGKGHVLSWVYGHPPASEELDLFAHGVSESDLFKQDVSLYSNTSVEQQNG